MSELITPVSASQSEYLPLLRVAVIIPNEGVILSPHPNKAELFSYPVEKGKPVSSEKRAKLIGSYLPIFKLPGMSATGTLGVVDGIQGYAVRPAAGKQEESLSNQHISQFHIEEVLEEAEQDPGCIDPVDLIFLMRAFRSRLSQR